MKKKAIFVKSKKWRGHGCKKKIWGGYVLLFPREKESSDI